MLFPSSHFVLHLYYVTSYFLVFNSKKLQNDRLYTIIPVPITCCTLTTKICPFSDLHITLDMDEIITAGLRKCTCCFEIRAQ